MANPLNLNGIYLSFSRFWLTIFVKDCKILESTLRRLTGWWIHPLYKLLHTFIILRSPFVFGRPLPLI